MILFKHINVVCLVCISAEQGYDPFNPEVVRLQEQRNGKPSASEDISGALELVNKAIEEVHSEVERERRKLSRIGDEPYDPSGSTCPALSDVVKGETTVANTATHLAYDPGSYQMTSDGYNPSPGCSKYTLDADNQRNSSNSMEYVPTTLKKPSSRTHTQQPPSPPLSTKYSYLSSSTSKYTVDNSRPSTDMEYDPLSNYSAGIAGKNKREESAQAGTVQGSKTRRPPGLDEEYVPAGKKPQQQSVAIKKYTFSESDGESSGTEYRPISLSSLQQRKANSVPTGDPVGNERKERTKDLLKALAQRNKDDSEQEESHKVFQLKNNLDKKKATGDEIQKYDKANKPDQNRDKTYKSSSSSKDKKAFKNSDQHSMKKENKNQERRDNGKSTAKVKSSEKVHKEDRRSDGKLTDTEKVKTDSNKRDKATENGARESKRPKTFDKEKKHSSQWQDKNGKLQSSKREKDVKKAGKSSSSIVSRSSRGSSSNSKDKARQSSTRDRKVEGKRRTPSLSHTDLFGDESAEEAETMEIDDEEEVLVRKSADALKRGQLNKRKASELTPSSSEDEGDGGLEGGRADQNEVASVGLDFSFQDELYFDSDPMEECLRIFNESKDVKKEDKGRQSKQVSPWCFPWSHFVNASWWVVTCCLCPLSLLWMWRRREAPRAL